MAEILLNNVDIANYGIKPLKYLERLFTIPSNEEVSYMNWYEGQIDVDLVSGVKLKKVREIEIEFYSSEYSVRYITFINLLLINPYNSFKFLATNETLNLRLKQQNEVDLFGLSDTSKFTLTFVEENYSKVLIGAWVECPLVDDILTIDSVNINTYGIVVIDNCFKDFLRYDFMHERVNGANGRINPQIRDVEIKLACTGLVVTDFIQNFYSFLGFLIAPNKREIIINYNNRLYQYNGFYNGMRIDNLIIHGVENDVWCEFSVKLKVW